jgi:monoamine oxidase
MIRRVVIIGAGIAGMTAAREIVKAGQSVLVLEARDRVGGRTAGHTLESGFTVEMGGQWVGPKQTEILRLIDELGLETVPTYDSGLAVIKRENQIIRSTLEDGVFGHVPEDIPEIERVGEELEHLAETIPLKAPWSAPNADWLDRQTLASWLDASTPNSYARMFYETLTSALFTVPAWEISLLHFLFYIKANGHLENMASSAGGNQDSRIVGGSHLISERMAEEIGPDGVRLNTPVRGISQDTHGVTVQTDVGEHSASRVIVTLPPALAGRMRYSPSLPPLRDQLTQQVPMGSVIKLQVAYERPFWRDAGLSGFSDNDDGPLHFTVDSSPDDGSCGVLAGFFTGQHARAVGSLPAEERRQLAIESLVDCFGQEAANPVEFVEKDWSAEEYTRGCYGGHFGTGVWTAFGPALSEPMGRIHWAGTETADISIGYMDGAVRSGKRAAGEVLAALTPAQEFQYVPALSE